MLGSPPEPDNECLETGETLIVAATANKRRTKCEFYSFIFVFNGDFEKDRKEKSCQAASRTGSLRSPGRSHAWTKQCGEREPI